jgi:hypothetical protein
MFLECSLCFERESMYICILSPGGGNQKIGLAKLLPNMIKWYRRSKEGASKRAGLVAESPRVVQADAGRALKITPQLPG